MPRKTGVHVGHFPADFHEGRERIHGLANSKGWGIEDIPWQTAAPAPRVLETSLLTSPGPRDRPTLIVSSGLHGIEGFLGSAIQAQLLESWNTSDVRIVLLHALNPYGFAYLRRVDEENRDLNRNFLLAGEAYEGSPPLYADLHPFLNPTIQRPFELFTATALKYVSRFGFTALQAAIAGGQYEFEKGLFFGGTAPAKLVHLLTKLYPDLLPAPDHLVLHLDVHSGLGKPRQLQLFAPQGVLPGFKDWLDLPMHREQLQDLSGRSKIYQARGDFGRWCHQWSPDSFQFLVAEFGTYHPLQVLKALRRENLEFHWSQQDPEQRLRSPAAQRLLEVFCPSSNRWRQSVLESASQLLDSALHYMDAASK